jgi:hypothetical protein
MDLIRIVDMLATMQMTSSGGDQIPFSIEFVTCNLKAGTGGKIITLERALLHGGPGSKSTKRNANHYENYTRNIVAAEGDQIIKIHALLVRKFNNAKVIL